MSTTVSDYFGSLVFDDRVMRAKLPSAVYDSLKKTIDGKVKYNLPEGTQSGTTFRLKGKGIPELNGRGRGDQYVTVYIETPRNLNREQKEALKKFAESVGDNNYEERKKFFRKFKK